MCTNICSTYFTYSSMFENCFISLILNIHKISLKCGNNLKSRPVSSIGRALDCESGDLGSISGRRWSLSLSLIMKYFQRSFVLYICSSMYRSFSSLQMWRHIVLVNCLTACPGTMRWLNCALMNSMWLTVVIRSENY
jgi:hypothetical protein